MKRAACLFLASGFLTVAGFAQSTRTERPVLHGEALPPSALGPGVVETMEAMLERERVRRPEDAASARSIPAPRTARRSSPVPAGAGALLGGGGTTPVLVTSFQGPSRGDPGTGWIPPDPHGAIGPNHFVAVVNQHISVYDRAGAHPVSMSLQSFFAVGGSVGDPRAAYDHTSGRFIVSCSDFNSRVRLAVSSSSDPTGSWFKTSIVVSSGIDTGHFPDYPTLGFDANGIYLSPFMVGGADTMSIFAIDKSPLVAPVQSLGTVTAFRGLPYEDSIQGCLTFGAAPGEYMVSRASTTTFRIRRVNPPLAAPTLSELGFVTVPANSEPSNAPVMGSATPLWTIDARPLGAVFQAGSLWTLHNLDVAGRSGVRWYRIDPVAATVLSMGTIDDPVRSYFFGSIAVNASGDLAIGCAGSHAGEFAGAWYSGRRASDPPGQTSPPALLKAGSFAYEVLDGSGFNRWGDYTNTTLDPVDPTSFWTIQEFPLATNLWGTWIGRVSFGAAPTAFCFGDGIDPDVTQPCPCGNFGGAGRGCANSVDPNGALLAAAGAPNPDTIVLQASGMPSIATTAAVFLQGDALTATGLVFGDGLRCADGNLVRIGSKPIPTGSAQYPELGNVPLSIRGGVVPGSGALRSYHTYYRNASVAFCPPETFNVTNGVKITW